MRIEVLRVEDEAIKDPLFAPTVIMVACMCGCGPNPPHPNPPNPDPEESRNGIYCR